MSRKYFVLLLLLAIGVLVLGAPISAQDAPRWDGGDDLPTNPLECPGEDPATPDPAA